MKKTIIALTLASLSYVSVQAQGTVLFNNSNTTKISTNSVAGGAATGVTGVALGQFYYALFSAAAGTTVGGSSTAVSPTALDNRPGSWVFDAANTASWTLQAIGTNTATSGRFASAVADGTGATSLSIAGGNSTAFVVVGWSANLGSTISQLQQSLALGTLGFAGESAIGTATPGIPGSTSPVGLFGTVSPSVTPFALGLTVPVPEPGTMALAALGGASLLLFRRKK